jgi:hypothetical protein
MSDNKIKTENYNEEALENILEFDFSADKEFDIEDNYKYILEFEELQEKAKLSHEEEVIDILGSKYVEPSFYEKINKLQYNIKNYFRKYDVNSDFVQNILDNNPEDDTLNRLFGIVKFMLNTYNRTVEELNFVFRFTREEYNLVNDLLKKIDVTGQEILVQGMDDLLEEMNEWKEIYKKTDKEQVELYLPLTVHSTFLIYHFLSKKTVKGFSAPFYNLRSIMAKLKEASDVFEAYKVMSGRVKANFATWTGSITPLNLEDMPPLEAVEDIEA